MFLLWEGVILSPSFLEHVKTSLHSNGSLPSNCPYRIKGWVLPGLEQFFSLFVPILFLSSFYPSPKHKNPPISDRPGQDP